MREANDTEREVVRTTSPVRSLTVGHPVVRRLSWIDLAMLVVLAGGLLWAVRLAGRLPDHVEGPTISLSPTMLPLYAAMSMGRLLAAYAISLAFTVVFGYAAASSRRSERILLPTLDVLQSTPIFSFLPAVLLAFCAVLPVRMAAEAASVVLIVTCQAWNIGFAWFQALTTIPHQLSEAGTIFRFNGWMRFKTVQLPFAAISLIWNSMVSWANGWFFLMAAEMLRLGNRDFRLPGLGTYVQEAANQGNRTALVWGVLTLLMAILALDQLVWRPLLSWASRFSAGSAGDEDPPRSWFHDLIKGARFADLATQATDRVGEFVDGRMVRWFPPPSEYAGDRNFGERAGCAVALTVLLLALWGISHSADLLVQVTPAQWREITVGIVATFGRVLLALAISLAWTLPVGVAIGTRPRLAARLQPLVQLAASVPATALFPVVLMFIPSSAGGLSIAAIILMTAGTQWYLLFNILAGASSIPQEMQYSASLLGFNRWQRWRYLILPALWPHIVTGSVVASGGAWNVCVVAEYVTFQGRTLQTIGAGATITRAAGDANYPLLLAATLTMVAVVILVNRLVWGRLFNLASDRYRME